MAARTTAPPQPSRAARLHQAKPPGSRLRRILRWALWLAIPVLAVIAGSLIGLVYAFARVPLPDQVPTAQTTVFLDASGKHEIGTLTAQENRRVVKFDKIPPVMRNAVLAAEDRDYYHHGAVSWRGLVRASVANLLHRRITEGGSTITQQYVKNAFPGVGRQRTIFRKLKEAVIANKLERRYSKDDILGFYLNTVYFGRGAYGVDAAARTFFSKPGHKVTADDLNTHQAALLAGVIRSPEFYSRKENATSAKARRDYVLQVMADRGWLSPKKAAAAMKVSLGVTWTDKPGGIVNSSAPYFLEKVRQYLVDKYGAAAVNLGGFRVKTTLDLRMQQQAKTAVQGVVNQRGDPRAALVAIDPQTGAVKAMYGGTNYKKRQWNYATDSIRQAGSTMKPFVLATALAQGISVDSNFPGPSHLVVNGHPYSNFGNEAFGDITLLEATKHSVNTVYVQLIDKVGPQNVAELAKKTGLTAELGRGTRVPPGASPLERPPYIEPYTPLALGSDDVTTLQLASAYGTWANRGVHQYPYLVEKVWDSNKRLIEQRDHNANGTRVVDPNVADTVNLALRGVVEGGTGVGARLWDRQSAGKTGTTQKNTDARYVGYTPNLVASVWLGYDNPKHKLVNIHGLGTVQGGSLPARIWRDFMTAATRGLEKASFVDPQVSGTVLNSTTTAPPTTQQQPLPGPTFPPQPTQPLPSVPPGPTLPQQTIPVPTKPTG
jgi:penicillin-binding protein 1A